MPRLVSELVEFVGEDTELMLRAKKAVRWFASTPEGRTVLEEAHALHGKPVKVSANHAITFSGYGSYEHGEQALQHEICYNPDTYQGITLKGTNGESMPYSIERFFAHEFRHASQPGVLEAGKDYAVRREAIGKEVAEAFNTPALDMTQYNHRFEAAGTNRGMLKRIYSEMYDEHLAPHLHKTEAIQQAVEDKLMSDPITRSFIDRYEAPAVGFENHLVHKYKGEPIRLPDYLGSGDVSGAIATLRDKEKWLEETVEGHVKAYEAATSRHPRIGGRDPQEIRPDAGAKTQGPAQVS